MGPEVILDDLAGNTIQAQLGEIALIMKPLSRHVTVFQPGVYQWLRSKEMTHQSMYKGGIASQPSGYIAAPQEILRSLYVPLSITVEYVSVMVVDRYLIENCAISAVIGLCALTTNPFVPSVDVLVTPFDLSLHVSPVRSVARIILDSAVINYLSIGNGHIHHGPRGSFYPSP